jgi:hypothetical protein
MLYLKQLDQAHVAMVLCACIQTKHAAPETVMTSHSNGVCRPRASPQLRVNDVSAPKLYGQVSSPEKEESM